MTDVRAHEIYMRRCFALAKQAGTATKTNPKVGAVIVHKNRIIGEGYHRVYGGNHAEVNAFNSVSEKDKTLLPESSLYISLEPCNHVGKTPPCTEQILYHGIKKVIISTMDPNPLMSGKSVAKLKEKGVDLMYGVLEEEGRQLILPFVINYSKKRPYVILKFAQSKDGYMGQKNKQIWLTNNISKMLVHKWRSEVDGIMIGTNTAILDNPQLTTRLYPGDSPLRIVIDRQHRIPLTHSLFSDDHPTLVFVENDRSYPVHNKKSIRIKFDENSLNTILLALFKNDITQVMIEGGASLLRSLISLNLWDEARVFRSPQILGEGIKAPIIRGKLIENKKLLEDELQIILNPNSA